MKLVWTYFGTLIFWLFWPMWFLHFRMFPIRSRVLIIHGSKVLLVKTWPGENKWSLPGGGVDKGETAEASAVRELKEEVGIVVQETELRDLGESVHSSHGLKYKAHFFSIEVQEAPPFKVHRPEITEAAWYELSEIRGRMLNKDAAFALKQYVPLDQTTLL